MVALMGRYGTLTSLLLFLMGPVLAFGMTPPHPSPTVDFTVPSGARYTNEVLWKDYPSVYDVKQVAVLDCWLPAVTLSILFASNSFVQSLFFYTNGTALLPPQSESDPQAQADTFPAMEPSTNLTFAATSPAAPEVLIKVWDPSDLSAPKFFTASLVNESSTEDYPGGVWWHSALTQGILLLGTTTSIPGVFPNGTIEGMTGDASAALTVFSGKEAMTDTVDSMSQDEFFEKCQKAPETPVVLVTIDNPQTVSPPVGDNHAYAVINATVNADGTRWVNCRNPWGAWVGWEVGDIMENVWGLAHLTNWDTLYPGVSG